MKKHFLLIATFLLVSNITKAQTSTYHPFPDSNAVWVTGGYIPFYPHTPYYTRVFLPINKQDTIINSKKYIKLFMDGASDNGSYQDTSYIGCIRDDTTEKVFFVPKDSSNEVLLYDFSKQAGDTVFNVYTQAPFSFYADYIIDSTSQVIVGPYSLKVLYLHPLPSPGISIIWIEKIGCIGNFMPFNSPCSFLDKPLPICMSINDTLFFNVVNGICWIPSISSSIPFSYTYGHCDIPVGIREINTQAQINISPNPVIDKINIENIPDEKVNIKITNIFGHEIYSIQLKNTNTFSIPLENQAPGLYFISIQTESEILIRKIIKL